MAYYDPERSAVNLLRQTISTDTNVTPVKTGLERFENVLGDLEASIDGLLSYVEKVKVRERGREGGGKGEEDDDCFSYHTERRDTCRQ